MKIWRELIIIIFIFGIIWIVFTWKSPKIESFDVELSHEREKELAELILDDLQNEYDFLDDSVILDIIHPIAKRLTDSIPESKYEYKFHIIDSNQINAFATIDGHVFIFSGLIKFVENPEELAGVIAHEIGHHENGDLVDRLIKELGLNVIMAVLTGGDAVMVSEISKMLVSSGYDRFQENEADKFAYELLIKTCINPSRIAHLFTRLKGDGKTYPDEMEILMTHPSTKKRIENALTVELPADFSEKKIEINWEELISKHFNFN